MILHDLADILIAPNRQRRTFNQERINALADSIATEQLFNAICIRHTADGPTLVSGERRLRAIAQLIDMGIPIRYDGRLVPLGKVPTTTLGELDALAREEAELSENVCRDDLTWQDRTAAEARLHELRQAQAEQRGLRQTVTATAAEIAGGTPSGFAVTALSQELLVARHLDDPEVAAAKSLSEAHKVVQKKAQRAHREQLSAQLGATQSVSRHTLHLGDFRTASLPAASFDVLITDPPYGIGADQFGTQGSREREYIDESDPVQLSWDIAQAASLHCKPAAHAYVFCAFENWQYIKTAFVQADWQAWPRPLIWSKLNGVLPVPNGGPRYTYECIFYARRGGKCTLQVGGDVLTYSSPATTGHPDQKPVPLYVELLRRSCLPGERIVDFFAGSGTVFPAANQLQLTAVACELSPQYYPVAAARMEARE